MVGTAKVECVDDFLEQHRAVLEYEHLVDAQQWGEIERRYPHGPPQCACLVCWQLEALSDRLVTLTRRVNRYEKLLQEAEPGADAELAELLDFARARGHHDVDAGGS